MMMEKTIRAQLEDVLEKYKIEFVESGLSAGNWTCTGATLGLNLVAHSRKYDCEILIDMKDYGDFFESDFGESSLTSQLRNKCGVIEIAATEEEEYNRVRVSFSTSTFFIGEC